MEISISTLSSYFTWLFAFLTWRDMIEISFISTIFYWSSLWLKNDRNKNLLPYFYGYLFFIFASHGLQLTTLTSFLLVCSPVVAMLFMLMHQNLLQRNFVSLKNVTLATHAPCADWLSSVMKSTLTMLSHNKNIIIVIEHTDALSAHFAVEEHLETPISDGLITLLFTKISKPEYVCWITSSGIVRGINAQFKASWHPHGYQSATAWIDDAVAYTSKTDAILLFANASQHNYTIAHNGMITEELMMEQAHTLIKKLINYQVPLPKKGYSHGIKKQKKYAQHSP